mgnify:CR=1 FL=1
MQKDYSEVLKKLQSISTNLSTDNKNNRAKTSNTLSLDYSYPNNKFDWVGIKHNDCLDYVASNIPAITDDSKNLTLTIRQPLSDESSTVELNGRIQKAIGLTQKYWNEKVMDEYVRPFVSGPVINNNYENNISSENIQYLTENKFIDPRLDGLDKFNSDFSLKLNHYVEAGKITTFEAEADKSIVKQAMETDDVQASIDIIKSAEKIIIEASIDETVRTRQLTFLSIFRNSIGYWANVIDDQSNPWWTINKNFFQRVGTHEGYARWSWHKFWGVLLTGIADAVGGVVGVFIEPPVLGAAVGGVVGSALSAVVDNVYP